MKKQFAIMIGLIAVISPLDAFATGATRYFAGSLCAGNENFVYSPESISAQGGTANVFCGTSAPGPYTFTFANVEAYYFNLTSGSVSCHWEATAGDGTYFSTSTLYSCSTAGGCTTGSAGSGTGYGYIEWTDTFGGNTLITGSSTTSTFAGLTCTLPYNIGTTASLIGYQTNTDH